MSACVMRLGANSFWTHSWPHSLKAEIARSPALTVDSSLLLCSKIHTWKSWYSEKKGSSWCLIGCDHMPIYLMFWTVSYFLAIRWCIENCELSQTFSISSVDLFWSEGWVTPFWGAMDWSDTCMHRRVTLREITPNNTTHSSTTRHNPLLPPDHVHRHPSAWFIEGFLNYKQELPFLSVVLPVFSADPLGELVLGE